MSQSDYIQRKRIATQVAAITHIHPDIKDNPPPVIIDVITDIKQCALEKTVSNNPTYNILNAPDATSQDRAVSTPIMGGIFPQFPTAQPVDSNNPSTGATGVSYFKTFNSTPGYISNTELRSNYIVDYISSDAFTLNLPTAGLSLSSFLAIYNNSTNGTSITLSTNSNKILFGGRFGTGLTTLLILPNSWITVAYNPETNTWDCIARSRENQRYSVVASGALVNLSNNNQYLNSDLFLTPDVNNRVFTLVNPQTNPNQGYKIYNSSSMFTLALRTPTGSFNGNARYSGPSTGNLENVPTNSWLQLYSDGTNWRITDKSATNQIFDYTLIGTLTIDGNFQLNSDINLTGTGGTLAIFNPTSNFVSDSYLKIFNKGTGTITVSPTGGSSFLGIYGSGSSSLIIPQNSWVKIVSNGTNWLCDERSPGFNDTSIAELGSETTDLTARLDFTNAFTYLNPTTNNPTVNIPIPGSAQTGKIYTIENLSTTNYLTLKIDSGIFTGAYGSNSNTLLLPLNSWISFYSNGTNWVCNKVSDYGWIAPLIYSNLTYQTINLSQWFREYIGTNANTNLVWSLNSPASTRQTGLTTRFKLAQANTAVGNRIETSGSSVNTGLIFISTSTSTPTTNFAFGVSGTSVLEVLQSGTIGTNTGLTCTGTEGSNILTIYGFPPVPPTSGYTANLIGVIGFNSTISISGNTYTVVGLKRTFTNTQVAGTCTGMSGSKNLTINSIVGGTFVMAGDVITISNNNYLVASGYAVANGSVVLATPLLTHADVSPYAGALTSPGWLNGTVAIYPPLSTSPSSTSFTITGNGAIYNIIGGN